MSSFEIQCRMLDPPLDMEFFYENSPPRLCNHCCRVGTRFLTQLSRCPVRHFFPTCRGTGFPDREIRTTRKALKKGLKKKSRKKEKHKKENTRKKRKKHEKQAKKLRRA